MYITPGSAPGESSCRRLSTHGCGDFGSHTSGTEVWGFGFGVCQQFYTMYISPGMRGGTGLPVALYSPSRRFWTAYKRNWRVWICFPYVSTIKLSMYEFPGLRGGNRLSDESLLTVTAILIRIQAERESRDFI